MKEKQAILIVEDDPLSRKLLSDLLTLKGYEVLEADNGESGMRMACAHAPGLILIDIQLPVMDGFNVVQVLKSEPKTRSLTIWAITAYAMPGDEDRIRAKGCDGYFSKPLDLHSLLARIGHHFDSVPARSAGDETSAKDTLQ